MKFKEFSAWCNDRACDGCWGMTEAIICTNVYSDIYKFPFWKREKYWRECAEKEIVEKIVKPTNRKIIEMIPDLTEKEKSKLII